MTVQPPSKQPSKRASSCSGTATRRAFAESGTRSAPEFDGDDWAERRARIAG